MATEYTQKEPTDTGWGQLPWGSTGDKEFVRGWGGVKTQSKLTDSNSGITYTERNDD